MNSNNEFHITVGVSPDTIDGKVSLQQELRLLKAALLYADKVKFCSLTSSLLLTLMQVDSLSNRQLLEIACSTGYEDIKDLLEIYVSRKRQRHPTKQDLIIIRRIEDGLKPLHYEIKDYLVNLAKEAGFDGLEAAYNSGLVEIELFEWGDNDRLVNDYFNVVSDAILSGKTYPLFDDTTGKLVSTAVKERMITPKAESLHRAKHVGLSSDLFHRLPLFEDASVDEVLDIRGELDRPLVNFRSAMFTFSDEIESEPWNEDFVIEAERVFLEQVKPSVMEIEDIVNSNSLMLKLVGKLPEASYRLGLAMTTKPFISDILVATVGLAAAGQPVLEALQDHRQIKREIQSNQLYFYYKAGKKLESK